MFESILNTVKSQIGGQLKEKAGLNDEQMSQAVDMAGESVQEVVKNEAANGNIDGLMHLFGSQDGHTSTTNPIVENIGNNFVSKMMAKLGVSDSVADLAKNLIMPYILKTVSSKFSSSGTNDASGLMSMFQGAGKGAIFNTLKDKAGQKLGGLF